MIDQFVEKCSKNIDENEMIYMIIRAVLVNYTLHYCCISSDKHCY